MSLENKHHLAGDLYHFNSKEEYIKFIEEFDPRDVPHFYPCVVKLCYCDQLEICNIYKPEEITIIKGEEQHESN